MTPFQKAAAAHRQGLVEEAQAHYEAALQLAPDSFPVLRNFGLLLMNTRQLPRAAECFARARLLTQDPTQQVQLAYLHEFCVSPKIDSIRRRFDANAADYDATDWTLNAEWPGNELSARIKRAAPQPVDRVLDLGCGTGRMGELLRSHCRHLTGVDISPRMIEASRAKRVYDRLDAAGIHEFLDADAAGGYGLICSSGVVTHFELLDGLFGRLARVLAPNGLLAFDTTDALKADTFEPKEALSLQNAHNPAYVLAAAAEAGLMLVEHSHHSFRTLSTPEASSIYIFTI